MVVKNITSTECDKKHGRIWKAIGVYGVLLGLMITLIGWSMDASNKAHIKATDTQTEMRTAFPFIREGIQDIKASQVRLESRMDTISNHD